MKCKYPLNFLKGYVCNLEAVYFYVHKIDKQTHCCCKYHMNLTYLWTEISKDEYLTYEVLDS